VRLTPLIDTGILEGMLAELVLVVVDAVLDVPECVSVGVGAGAAGAGTGVGAGAGKLTCTGMGAGAGDGTCTGMGGGA